MATESLISKNMIYQTKLKVTSKMMLKFLVKNFKYQQSYYILVLDTFFWDTLYKKEIQSNFLSIISIDHDLLKGYQTCPFWRKIWYFWGSLLGGTCVIKILGPLCIIWTFFFLSRNHPHYVLQYFHMNLLHLYFFSFQIQSINPRSSLTVVDSSDDV